VSYGLGAEGQELPHVSIRTVSSEPGRSFFTLVTPGGSVAVELRLHGKYNVWNFAGAAAAALHAGVPLDSIAEVGLEVETQPGRGRVIQLAGITLVDDSYNSNPRALQAALESASKLPCQRLVLVAGSMLELGDDSQRLHQQLGAAAVDEGFSLVLGVGEQAAALVESARQAGAEVGWYQDVAAAAEEVPLLLLSGDVVLVKGSRGVALESLVERIEHSTGAAVGEHGAV